MSFLNSLTISAFGLGIVFAVLIALSLIVFFASKVFSMLAKKAPQPEIQSPLFDEAVVGMGYSSGELKLLNVDERTAAIIMCIVSDESGIPLSELQFRSIKALD